LGGPKKATCNIMGDFQNSSHFRKIGVPYLVSIPNIIMQHLVTNPTTTIGIEQFRLMQLRRYFLGIWAQGSDRVVVIVAI
jgi:hypothetical protein